MQINLHFWLFELIKIVPSTSRYQDLTLFRIGAGSSTHIDGDKLYLTTKESRDDLPYKMKAALDYVYTVFNTTYDWILKADDDTYMIMENLKMMLARFDHRDSSYLGAHFKVCEIIYLKHIWRCDNTVDKCTST